MKSYWTLPNGEWSIKIKSNTCNPSEKQVQISFKWEFSANLIIQLRDQNVKEFLDNRTKIETVQNSS